MLIGTQAKTLSRKTFREFILIYEVTFKSVIGPEDLVKKSSRHEWVKLLVS